MKFQVLTVLDIFLSRKTGKETNSFLRKHKESMVVRFFAKSSSGRGIKLQNVAKNSGNLETTCRE